MDKECEICHSNNKVVYVKKVNKLLCNRHAKQIYRYGIIKDSRKSRQDDLYVFYKNVVVMNIYNKYGTYITSTEFDIDDFEKVKKYKWCIVKGHVYAKNMDNKTLYLHRLIMNVTDKNVEVDHIDGNPLNNKKSNLRLCTHDKNMLNHKVCSNNTSGVTGVTFDKQRNKWCAQIVYKNKNHHLGRFDLFEDAVLARRNAEIKYFGNFRRQVE